MASEQCTATAKSTGNRCTQTPVPGGKVCRFHGGKAPQVQAAAAERLVEQEIRRNLAHLDVDPVEDPFGELSKLAGQVVAWKDALAAKVNGLVGDAGCDTCGNTGGDRLRYEASGVGTEQLRSEVALFERGMDRCASVLATIAKLNIDDRLARISDRQAEAILRAIDVALASAGVTGEAAQQARQVAARELRKTAP